MFCCGDVPRAIFGARCLGILLVLMYSVCWMQSPTLVTMYVRRKDRSGLYRQTEGLSNSSVRDLCGGFHLQNPPRKYGFSRVRPSA
jgi:hypothetical protein